MYTITQPGQKQIQLSYTPTELEGEVRKSEDGWRLQMEMSAGGEGRKRLKGPCNCGKIL